MEKGSRVLGKEGSSPGWLHRSLQGSDKSWWTWSRMASGPCTQSKWRRESVLCVWWEFLFYLCVGVYYSRSCAEHKRSGSLRRELGLGCAGESRGRLGYGILRRFGCFEFFCIAQEELCPEFVKGKAIRGHLSGCVQDLFFAEKPQRKRWVTQQTHHSLHFRPALYVSDDIFPRPVCSPGTVCTFPTCHSSHA